MAISDDRTRLFTTTDEDGNPIGITTWEIMACTGYYKRDKKGKRNIGLIATHADINIWAKNKFFVKVNQSTRHEIPTYEERKTANFGLEIPHATSPATLRDWFYTTNNNETKMNGWKRQIPLGEGYKQPFRYHDMDGYYHKAVCPFQDYTPPTAGLNQWETSKFVASLRISGGAGENTDSITLTDIPEIEGCYFTIQMRHQNPEGKGVYIRTISAESTFGESMGGATIEFSTYQLPKGNWDVIPFLSPVKFGKEQDGNEIPASYKYYPIPRSSVSVMKIAEVAYLASGIDGYKLPYLAGTLNYRVAYNFAITNNDSQSHRFNNIVVQIRETGKKFEDSLSDDGGVQEVFSGIEIASGETVKLTDALANGGMAFKWQSISVSEQLYNNPKGLDLLVKLGNGEPVFRGTFKVSTTDSPEYKPDPNPTVPEI